MRYLVVLGLWFLSMAAMAHEDGRSAAQVETLARSTHSWNGAMLPTYPAGQAEVTILKIRIPAGARLPVHYHPVINAGVLIEGELTVEGEDGAILHLVAGDAIIEMVNTPHYGRNDGDKDAVIIVFYAGIEKQPVTVIAP